MIRAHLQKISHHELVIVHGGCPDGADRIADDIATALGLPIERHFANWHIEGRPAGLLRNARMVALGADVCLAYIHNRSRGATHCADLAEKAGIPTWRFEINDQESR